MQIELREYFIEEGDIVFDVGAHIGNKTDIFLQKGATVVCIEPQPNCVQELRRKYKNNPRVIIIENGLADKPGQMQLSVCSAANTISTFSEEWKKGRFSEYKWDQTIQVEVTTLDEIIKQYGLPKYCKIDVEGFEYQVLQGLHKPIPYLSFEFTSEFLDNAKKCVQYLQSIGYDEFNITLGEDDHFKFSNWVNIEPLFSLIERENMNNNLLWGDIYARSNIASQDEKVVKSNVSDMKKIPKLNIEGNILDQIEQAGLWSEGKPLRLHLGCGEQHFDGYVNVDFPPSEHTTQTKVGADIFADITTLNFPSESVDEIRLHHVFEHFDRPTALALLCLWNWWLKIGGKLIIETPDFKASMALVQSFDYSYQQKQVVMRHIFGSHEAHWAIHCDGWYEEKFRYILEALGFSDLRFEFSQWQMTRNITVYAHKRHHTNLNNLQVKTGDLLRDSLVDNSEGEMRIWQVWQNKLTSHINKLSNYQIITSAKTVEQPQTRLTKVNIYTDSPSLDKSGYDNSDPYSNGEYHLLKSLVHSGDIVFDVGASRGSWSREVLSIATLNKLYAFEPIPKVFDELKHNLSAYSNISLNNSAISSQNGKRTFYWYVGDLSISEMSNLFRRIEVERQQNIQVVPIEVETQTLDSFCYSNSIERIDFLKIDTKGAEMEVLQGANRLLKEGRIRHLQFEYGGTYTDAATTLREIYELLSLCKYALFRIVPDGLIHIRFWHDSLENYRYANYLAVAPWASGSYTTHKIEGISAHKLSDSKETPPLVSIFMPVYNSEKYLSETLDSLLSQTFQDFEVIIADDGSTDRTLEIAKSYEACDSRIKVLSLPHGGEVVARNEAIKNSNPNSKYLLNHDSDDISLPTKLEKLVEYLDNHPEIAIVGCFAEYFDDEGNYKGKPKIEWQPERIRETFGQVNSMINSASLIRREVFEKIGNYREEFRGIDDYDFFARALLAGFNLANIPEVLHRIRLHPESIGSTRAQTVQMLAEKVRMNYKQQTLQKHESRQPQKSLSILHTVEFYQPKTTQEKKVDDIGRLYVPQTAEEKYYLTSFNDVMHINCDNKPLSDSNRLDIVTIAFNNVQVIEYQIRLLNKYMLDPFYYTVADNSPDREKQEKIMRLCKSNNVAYIRLPENSYTGKDPSSSHGFALNWIYANYLKHRKAKYFGFIDHDIFPIRHTKIIDFLKVNYIFGHLQRRDKIWYLWPGFCFFTYELMKDANVNFMPGEGCDTGGRIWESVYSRLDESKIPQLRHVYERLRDGDDPQSDWVEYIGDWMHIFNASQWKLIKPGKDVLVNNILNRYLNGEDKEIYEKLFSNFLDNARTRKESLSILHTVEFYYPHIGGAEVVVQQVSERLAKRGHHVEVATTKLPERNFRDLNGVLINEFEVAGNIACNFSGRDIRHYQEFLLNHPADVMMNYAAQQWATDLAFFVLEATRNKRVNVIAPCGYSALEDTRTLRWPQFADYFGKIIPVAIPYYDAAIYHSSMYKDYEFAKLHGFQNSVVIPNGVDEEEFTKKQEVNFREKYAITTPFIGLCVANFYREKGLDRIIESVRQMNRSDFTMVFIGKDGDQLPSLKAQATGLDIRFLVDIPRANTVAAFHAADIFLFGSYIEASPLVIIEAKASKTPFVSTDCGNVKEWKGGIVCSPEDLAVNANRILDDESLRKQLAEEGYREWKEKLTWEAVVDKYEDLYLRLHHAKITEKKEAVSLLVTESNDNEERTLLEKLQKDFKHVPTLIRLAEIELQRANQKKARNYLIAALALEPRNEAAKALLEKLQ